MSSIDRAAAKAQGAEAVEIIRTGRYTAADGTPVDVADALAEAVRGTVSYPPHSSLPSFPLRGRGTVFEVANESTLSAARRLSLAGLDPAALSFASAKNPGGGFLGGARAQEESLCRSSGLYACLVGGEMYRDHAGTRGGFYTNYAIYSPGVPVFRDDEGELLAEPFRCAFVTAPAVNAGTYLSGGRGTQAEVEREMRERVRKVLHIIAAHGHDAVVLGAWGCGVFRNDPEVVAELFREALMGEFAGAFGRVVFAVLDSSAEGKFIDPFERRFASR
ncbi:hypothetical protein DFJ74DRAFT_689225 [Hyaloraphidium curvatum]|nr:hypothetical protein DFJ74DRAFT_689225 [Hyaloraphidium curvatum]